MNDAPSLKLKIKSYVANPWNRLDIFNFFVYIVGISLRFFSIAICGLCFYASRIIFAFNHMMFLFRILHMFAIFKSLGPKLVMINKMVRFFVVL